MSALSSRWAALAALVLVMSLAPSSVRAQDAKTARKVGDLNRAAMEDYDLLEFDGAKKQLADALALLKKGKGDKSALAAKTHLNLAIVYGAGLGDQDTALLEFIAALQIDPNLKLDPAYRSPALQKTFDQAKATVGSGREGGVRETGVRETGPPTVGPTTPAAGEERGLKHTPVEDAPGDQPILISARVGADVRNAQLTLSYRAAGADGFTALPMKTTNAVEFQAIIPEGATRGATVHYFIEARSAAGKLLAASGNAETPNIISISHPTAKSGGGGDDENPLGKRGPANSDGDGGGGGDDGSTTVARAATPGKHSFWIGVSVGSGAGYIKGETEVSHQTVTCCVGFAPLHVAPEVGLWLSPHLALSLAGRIGFPLGANVQGAATLAPAGFLRLGYHLGNYGGFLVHGDLGAGFIRHVIKLTATSATAAQGDTDTFATGPLFVGGGLGWAKTLGGPVRFVVDLDVLVGLPVISDVGSGTVVTKLGFAVNGDLSLGLQLAF
jgi:hypothetical protein